MQHLARSAAELAKKTKGGLSLRSAAQFANENYEGCGVTVSFGSNRKYINEDYDPRPRGKDSYLPDEFKQHLVT